MHSHFHEHVLHSLLFPLKLPKLIPSCLNHDVTRRSCKQVVIVGDLNIAASPLDVHPVIGYENLYCEEEKRLLALLLADYCDAWRQLHPGVSNQYTV